jgi:hypothetical protein
MIGLSQCNHARIQAEKQHQIPAYRQIRDIFVAEYAATLVVTDGLATCFCCAICHVVVEDTEQVQTSTGRRQATESASRFFVFFVGKMAKQTGSGGGEQKAWTSSTFTLFKTFRL